MYTLGSKALVINDAALVDITGTVMSIPGFGSIDNTDSSYSKITTPGVLPTISTTDMSGITAPVEVAIYWKNLRYIGEGVGNMSSPQDPTVIMVPTGFTFAQAFVQWEEDFGTSELFYMNGNVLTAKNVAVSIIEVYTRPINDPTDDPFTTGTGFKYNRFGGTIYGTPSVQGTEGVGNGTQVEESVRTASFDATDPYSTKEHGSEEVELDALYDIYDFTVQRMGAIPVLASGLIAAVSITTAGVTYDTDGTFPATATGGTGTGATFSVTITGGVVTNVVVTNPGTGYTVADVLTLNVSGSTPVTAATITVDATSSVTGASWDIHENLAQTTPDENVINQPIQLRIYAKQGDASTPIAGF